MNKLEQLREKMLSAGVSAYGCGQDETDACVAAFDAFIAELEEVEVDAVNGVEGTTTYYAPRLGIEGVRTTIYVPKQQPTLREAAEAVVRGIEGLKKLTALRQALAAALAREEEA